MIDVALANCVTLPEPDPDEAPLLAQGDALAQPFVDSVRSHGARSMVVIDGQLTHSIRKEPRFGDAAESVSGPLPIAADDAALVKAATQGARQ